MTKDIITRRIRQNRELRSRAIAQLIAGDIIRINRGRTTTEHYAQVIERPDTDNLGVRGLLGGGCTFGPLPLNTTEWEVIGHAPVGPLVNRNDPAQEIAAADRRARQS